MMLYNYSIHGGYRPTYNCGGGAHCNYSEAVSSSINQVTDVSTILFPLKAIICRMSLIDFPSEEKYVIIHQHQHINNVRNKQTWHCPLNVTVIEGSLEVKLPTIWTVEKQR